MSEATEREAMRTVLVRHALMSAPEVARVLGVDPDVARGMIERGDLPSVPVGRRRKVDPLDLAVHILAGRDGVTPAEFWKIHGAATGEHARRYIETLERWQAA